jgi:putative Holliday junction resolvase
LFLLETQKIPRGFSVIHDCSFPKSASRPIRCSPIPVASYAGGAEQTELENTSPPRYLGLDVGAKRIGVAVSDELGLTAQPVLTLERKRNPREDLRSLGRLARRFAVAGIVVGRPLHLSGEASARSVKIEVFAAELGAFTGLPIHMWDERLTTHEAHRILYEAGRARQSHRKVVDQVAATLILQSFLESRDQGTKGPRDREGREQGSDDSRAT